MSGLTDINHLIKHMSPVLNAGEYVFVSEKNADANFDQIDLSHSIGMFKEEEGMTVILPRTYANQLKLNYSSVMAWITLDVHSSLEAVGLTAAFAKALGETNISCNVVAAYFHDHVFVPLEDAERAISALKQLASEGISNGQ